MFTYEAAKQRRTPQPDAPGPAAAEIGGAAAPTTKMTPVATASGVTVLAGADGFLFVPTGGPAA